MFQKLLILVALVSVSVSAQDSSASATSSGAAVPTSTAGISPCVLQCSIQAGAAAGCTFSEPSCACSTTNGFQESAATCLQQTCTPEEQQAALGLQGALCGAASSGALSSTAVSASGSATTEDVSSSTTRPLSSASVVTTAPLSSGSVTRPATSASTTAPATGGTGTPAPANTSNAAMGMMRVGGEKVGLVGAGVAAVGAILGAAMVL